MKQKVEHYVEAVTSAGWVRKFAVRYTAIEWLKKVTAPRGEGWVVEHFHTPEDEWCPCARYNRNLNPVVVGGKEVK